MAKSTNIEQKIKESFESVQHKAPENLWLNINNRLSGNTNELDNKVKSSFETNTDKAPEGIWESIDKQLTIDKGWIRVHKLLQRRTFFKWTKRVAAFIIFLFFVTPEYGDRFSGSREEFNNNTNYFTAKVTEPNTALNKGKDIRTERFNSESGSDDINNTDFSKKKESYADNNLPTKFSEPSQSYLIKQKDGFQLTKEVISTSEKGMAVITQDFSKSRQNKYENLTSEWNSEDKSRSDLTELAVMATLPIKSVRPLKAFAENLELIEINIELPKETKVEFGLYTALNSTSIINNATRRAFDAKSLVAYNPSLGSNLGFQFVYHFNANHSLASAVMQAGVRQSYNKYSNGSLNEEGINLNFMRLQTLYQFKHKRFHTQKSMFNMKVGPYFGFMTKSDFKINNQVQTEVLDNFNVYDIGLTLQVGHSVEWSKLILDYGLNMDKGLTNLYRGTDFVPASFDRTTLLGIGTYVSLRYKL